MRWAWRNMDVDSPGALAVLLVLADHAGEHDGEDWTCYPAVSLIAARTRLTERAVERHLLWLIEERWISRAARGVRQEGKGKFIYTIHRQRLERTASALPDKMTGQKGRALPDNLALFTRQKRQSPPHPPYIAEPPINPHSKSAGEADFEEVWKAWARTVPDGVARPADLKAWREALGKVAAADLALAALAYLDRSPGVKRGRGKSLRRWLDEEGWLPWQSDASSSASASAVTWAGPPDVRAAVVASCGEGFAVSYLDPAAWHDGRRVITPRTGVARDALRGHPSLWTRLAVTIAERAATSSTAEA
jgi:hypothetical protein